MPWYVDFDTGLLVPPVPPMAFPVITGSCQFGLRRHSDRCTGAVLSSEAPVAFPVVSRTVEIAVFGNLHSNAQLVCLAITALTDPVVPTGIQKSIWRHFDDRTGSIGWAESTATFPTAGGDIDSKGTLGDLERDTGFFDFHESPSTLPTPPMGVQEGPRRNLDRGTSVVDFRVATRALPPSSGGVEAGIARHSHRHAALADISVSPITLPSVSEALAV